MLLISATIFAGNKDAGNGLMGMLRNFRATATNTFTVDELATGYAFSSVGTNEVHDFTMPTNAVVAERIAIRGAHDDGFRAQEGTLFVSTDGTVAGRACPSCRNDLTDKNEALFTGDDEIWHFTPLADGAECCCSSRISYDLFADDLPDDWGSTSPAASFYFSRNAESIADTLLMVGVHSKCHGTDIPFGRVYGLWCLLTKRGEEYRTSLASVGVTSGFNRTPRHG